MANRVAKLCPIIQRTKSIESYLNADLSTNNIIKSLIGFILQNGGKLSKKKKSKYFEELSMAEVEEIERVVVGVFDGL